VRSLDLTKVDVEDLLDCYEIDHSKPSSTGEIAICCVFHGESNPSCHINSETTAWNCKGCGEKGNAIHFVSKLENISRQEAELILKYRYDRNFREPVGGPLAEFEESIKATTTHQAQSTFLPEAYTEKFWPMPEEGFRYLWERGLTNKTIRDLELGWDDFGRRITFPIRDAMGRLLGFKGRAVDPGVKAKSKVLGNTGDWDYYGFPKYDTKRALYLEERQAKSGLNWCCVVEGELDAAALKQIGYPVVGIGGSSPTKEHALALRRLVDRVVLFFDSKKPDGSPDESGQRATLELNALLEPFMSVGICADHTGDPADALINKNGMTIDIVHELIEQAQPLYLIELDF
jgi:DNA primase